MQSILDILVPFSVSNRKIFAVAPPAIPVKTIIQCKVSNFSSYSKQMTFLRCYLRLRTFWFALKPIKAVSFNLQHQALWIFTTPLQNLLNYLCKDNNMLSFSLFGFYSFTNQNIQMILWCKQQVDAFAEAEDHRRSVLVCDTKTFPSHPPINIAA